MHVLFASSQYLVWDTHVMQVLDGVLGVICETTPETMRAAVAKKEII